MMYNALHLRCVFVMVLYRHSQKLVDWCKILCSYPNPVNGSDRHMQLVNKIPKNKFSLFSNLKTNKFNNNII